MSERCFAGASRFLLLLFIFYSFLFLLRLLVCFPRKPSNHLLTPPHHAVSHLTSSSRPTLDPASQPASQLPVHPRDPSRSPMHPPAFHTVVFSFPLPQIFPSQEALLQTGASPPASTGLLLLRTGASTDREQRVSAGSVSTPHSATRDGALATGFESNMSDDVSESSPRRRVSTESRKTAVV